MEFRLKAKKFQLKSSNANNVEFITILEPKSLVVSYGRERDAFSYKKLKLFYANSGTDLTIQSDGLKVTIHPHSRFQEQLNAAMSGTLSVANHPQPEKKLVNHASGRTVALPKNQTTKFVNEVGRSSGVVPENHHRVKSLTPEKVVASPVAVRRLDNASASRSDHHSIARAFRPVNPKTIVSTSNSTSGNNSELPPSFVSKSASVEDSSWLDDDRLDFSVNDQKSTAAPLLTRVYGQKSKTSNVMQFLHGRTPDLTRKNLFGADSSSGQKKTDPDHNHTGKLSDSTSYNQLYSPSLSLSSVSRLGQLGLKVHSSANKKREVASPDPAWQEQNEVDRKENKSAVSVPPRTPFRKASSFFDHFRTSLPANGSHISNNNNTSSSIGSIAVSKRIPGGIRNLGNSCYIGSILQVEYF